MFKHWRRRLYLWLMPEYDKEVFKLALSTARIKCLEEQVSLVDIDKYNSKRYNDLEKYQKVFKIFYKLFNFEKI